MQLQSALSPKLLHLATVFVATLSFLEAKLYKFRKRTHHLLNKYFKLFNS